MADVGIEAGDTGGLQRTLKDLFAGAAGGVAQVLLGENDSLLLAFHFTLGQFSSLIDICALRAHAVS